MASSTVTHHEGKRGCKWKQTFTMGYVQQAFERACVRESLQHGEENAAYQQRADARRKAAGKAITSRKAHARKVLPMATIHELAGKFE